MVENSWGVDKWTRSNKGWVAGVCEGLGQNFGIEPWVLRLGWIISILAFGFGLLVYVILALVLPRRDQVAESNQGKFLGVCHRLSHRTNLDIGLLRFLCVMLALSSLGATVVGYLVLYFVLPGVPGETKMDRQPDQF